MKSYIRIAAGLVAFGCVGAHAQTVVAPSAVSYDEYGSVTEALIDAPGDPVRGAEIIASKGMGNCVACHQNSDMPDVAFQGEIGPSFDGVADRWTEADLRGIVSNAKMMFPGTIMPAFYKNEGYVRPGNAYTGKAAPAELDPLLTAQQVEDVVAYLKTLKEN